MDYPRRSARLSPHASSNSQRSQTSMPAFGASSQTSSTTTTSYPSPTEDAENDQNTSQIAHQLRYPPQLNCQPSMSHSHLNPPLPSPSAGYMDPVFGRPYSQLNPYQSSHSHPQHQQQQQQQQRTSNPPADQNPRPCHHNSISQSNNNSNQQGVLPDDFLAEAAKRAQMACLMRDLGDVSL